MTNHLAILTPTRGRPERAAAMLEAVKWAGHEAAVVYFGLDEDDPTLPRYLEMFEGDDRVIMITSPGRHNLVEWTNFLAKLATTAGFTYLASLGDDHLARTPGWDTALTRACTLFGPAGYAFGNDLLRPDLPTAWVQSTAIFEALGWMMLPTCEHLYVDNVTLDLGRAADRIARLDHIIIEHMHPAAGKATEDDSYRASNSPERINADRAAYERWARHGLDSHADTIRNLH